MQSFLARLTAGSLLFGLVLITGCSDGSDATNSSLVDAARLAALDVGVAFDDGASAPRRTLAAAEFTSITAENSMKWARLTSGPDDYDFEAADTLVEFAEANGQRVRGHTLFWHRLNGLPDWLLEELGAASDPATRLRGLMINHVSTVVGRYAGRLAQWDVVNEPLAIVGGEFDPENIFFAVLGEAYIDLALLEAHTADPSAELFINETFTEFQPDKFDALIALARRLLDRGVPLHGLGLQGHFFLQAPDQEVLRDQLARIAALGLKAEITELDIPLSLFSGAVDPLAAQAQAYAAVFNACLSVTLCSGITVWGLDDANTWLDSFALSAPNAPNRPLLFDAELQAKPAYDSIVQALVGSPR